MMHLPYPAHGEPALRRSDGVLARLSPRCRPRFRVDYRYSPPMGVLSSTSQVICVSGASEPATEQYLSNES